MQVVVVLRYLAMSRMTCLSTRTLDEASLRILAHLLYAALKKKQKDVDSSRRIVKILQETPTFGFRIKFQAGLVKFQVKNTIIECSNFWDFVQGIFVLEQFG